MAVASGPLPQALSSSITDAVVWLSRAVLLPRGWRSANVAEIPPYGWTFRSKLGTAVWTSHESPNIVWGAGIGGGRGEREGWGKRLRVPMLLSGH